MVNLPAIWYHIITEKGNFPRMTAKPRPRGLIASHLDLFPYISLSEGVQSSWLRTFFMTSASKWLPGSNLTLSIQEFHYISFLRKRSIDLPSNGSTCPDPPFLKPVMMMITASTPEAGQTRAVVPRLVTLVSRRHSGMAGSILFGAP